jgi:hypothetical protein
LGRLAPEDLARPFGRPSALLFLGVEPYTDDVRVQNNRHEISDFVRIARTIKERFEVLAALDDVLSRHSRIVFLMFGNLADISRGAWEAVRGAEYDCAFTRHVGCKPQSLSFAAVLSGSKSTQSGQFDASAPIPGTFAGSSRVNDALCRVGTPGS